MNGLCHGGSVTMMNNVPQSRAKDKVDNPSKPILEEDKSCYNLGQISTQHHLTATTLKHDMIFGSKNVCISNF